MVRKERLELSRLTALEPKSSASTNSATFALFISSFEADYSTKNLFNPYHCASALLALHHQRENLRQFGERYGMRNFRQ
jgi:hypothetical protein